MLNEWLFIKKKKGEEEKKKEETFPIFPFSLWCTATIHPTNPPKQVFSVNHWIYHVDKHIDKSNSWSSVLTLSDSSAASNLVGLYPPSYVQLSEHHILFLIVHLLPNGAFP